MATGFPRLGTPSGSPEIIDSLSIGRLQLDTMNIAAEKRYAIVTWAVVFVAVLAWALFAFGFGHAYFTVSFVVFQGFIGFVSIFGLARYYVTLKGCGFSRKKVLALAIYVWIAVTGFMVFHLCDRTFFVGGGNHSAFWYVFLVLAATSELAAIVVSTEVGIVALTDHEKAKELELHGIRAIRRN
jgi:hypothetical protein